ncbi:MULTISPECIES: DUF6000 family protein [Streptomyces]|uniref:Uncharacterized protein n=1 Tax=Streptomyces venezuelae (strain ATCC 10712 / CBS 650.69 / DSM 40230 / JCM 4526 / NBRC 13096 / PD 04745) TaxID=953739 RepID=F2RKK9_STRVP|nr:DUF6000 family protein [Streptomyces venezuelae]CCA60365.1 hypothetical protein SVEN_7079 [Streptomyces venezuelae ATCC 10712]
MNERRQVTGLEAHAAGGTGRMTLCDPRDIGMGHVVRRYVQATYWGRPRYLEIDSALYARPEGPGRRRFVRRVLRDAAAVTDAELDALLNYEWRSRLTAAWLIGVDRRASYRERIGTLLLDSEVCFAGVGYCFALARLGTRADAELLVAYLDRYLARPELDYDQAAALGALLRLDAELGTAYADRIDAPDGPWDTWVGEQAGSDASSLAPERLRAWTDLRCDFADGWTRP